MIVASSVVDQGLRSLGESLPHILGAVVLLVVGLAIAWLVGRVVHRLLLAVGVDDLAERFGIHDAIERVGLERSLSRVLGVAARIALTVVVVVAAVSLLGLGALSLALNRAVLFVPKLFVALVLVLAGVVVGQFVGERVGKLGDQMALGGPLRQFTELAIIALFSLTALAELGIPTSIVLAVVAVVVAAIVLTIALAFGLGGREVARELSAGRYLQGAFELGQRISVQGLSGEIVALENAATVLRTEDGLTARVPNHLLIDSVVTVHGEPAGGSQSA